MEVGRVVDSYALAEPKRAGVYVADQFFHKIEVIRKLHVG